jgi:hypothetical protein
MKRELALQLLQTIIPGLDDESKAASLFRELQFLADYKYNKYEMYHPGRLFLENLYLWLQQFKEHERADALAFVRKQLIFVSRDEFQQLAQTLYNDSIRPQQFEIAAQGAGLPRHRVKAIRESAAFAKTARASLYVGLSDGARLDFIRRHNLDINNEQVLPYYAVDPGKLGDCLRALRVDLGDPDALFQCLFLVDDFCGSGRTLLREVVSVTVASSWEPPPVPRRWESRLRFRRDAGQVAIELLYSGELPLPEREALLAIDNDPAYVAAVNSLEEKCRAGETELKGSLPKVAKSNLVSVLEPRAAIYLCPLLTTEYALDRLRPLLVKLPEPFATIQVLPGAMIDSSVRITSAQTPIGALCETYYDESLGDEHTGNVTFGYDSCGLPLVLHHNTPNNSIFLLWARRGANFTPLFVRYERHGREGV